MDFAMNGGLNTSARDAIAELGDSALSLEDFYRCRLCSKDVTAFEPWSVLQTPLDVVLSPVVRQ